MTGISDLPILYHTHHSRHPEDLDFWSRQAALTRLPILELGCGTGRILLPLLAAGHNITGLDLDLASLSFLCSLAAPDTPPVFQADMAAFHLDKQFGLAIIPCNTFSTLDAGIRRATLATIHRHLLPGGRLVISMPNPVLLKRLRPHSDPEIEDTFLHPLDGEPVQVSSGWQRQADRFTVHWHYDHLLPDGHVRRTSASVCHSVQPHETWLDELSAAGFIPGESLGDYDGAPFSPGTASLILTATRPAF